MVRAHVLGSAVALILSTTLHSVAHAETGRSIAVVLDASGSMNAKLPDGTARIEAAKSAVADLVARLPGDARLALRAYGHQSPTQQKNCQDTALLVPFATVASNKTAVIAAARGIRGQGYTPITYVLKLAAEDLGKEDAASHVGEDQDRGSAARQPRGHRCRLRPGGHHDQHRPSERG
jgi:Ca-activated chloride channel family protein